MGTLCFLTVFSEAWIQQSKYRLQMAERRPRIWSLYPDILPRVLYPLWLRKRDDPTSVTSVLVNARRENHGRYFISIKTCCSNAQGAN